MSPAPDTIDPDWAWQPFSPTDSEPWNRALVTHLFRRAAFGAAPAEIAAAVALSPAAVVDRLLQGADDTSNFQNESEALAATLLSTGEPRQLAAWWAYVMVHTPHPLLERLTLFWHGHFAVSAAKVTDAELMLAQNRLFRSAAFGEFRPLVHAVARDPAMLLFLDSATNRKARPNENFARELMELFCLGEGHYSEKDVQELARCFTGWEIKQGKFRFNRYQHDGGEKTVLGRTDVFPDGAAIDWILEQPQAAMFIAGKLYREFVCDEPAPDPQLLQPLADEFRDNGMQVASIVRRILTSNLFYSPHARARKVRSPVDAAIGLLRTFEGAANTHRLAADLQQNGQGLFFPPNVKGWDGGRAWINSSTILGRANMAGRLVGDEAMRFGGGRLDEYFARHGAVAPEQVVDWAVELLLATPLSAGRRDQLIEIARGSDDKARQVAAVVRALATLPEFQLC